MKSCLGTQNPLQNHWQNRLEHNKGYNRMRVCDLSILFLWFPESDERWTDPPIPLVEWLFCSTIKRLLWIVLVLVDFSLQGREREREWFVLFFHFFATQPFSFSQLTVSFLCDFWSLVILNTLYLRRTWRKFHRPIGWSPQKCGFSDQGIPPKMPKTLSEVF